MQKTSTIFTYSFSQIKSLIVFNAQYEDLIIWSHLKSIKYIKLLWRNMLHDVLELCEMLDMKYSREAF